MRGAYLPPGFTPSSPPEWETRELPGGGEIRQVRVTPGLVEELCAYLMEAGERILRRLPIEAVVEILDEAAAQWLAGRAPDYAEAVEAMRRATLLSPEMTLESLRKEQESSRAEDIRAALVNEFGDPAVLDRFVSRPGARAKVRALGPALTLCVLPGNIPGLSHLSFMRALLVKSPCLGKPAAGEPVYAAAYCRTLAGIDPGIGECVAALYWRGGDEEIERAALRRAEGVIAYGTAEACADVARRARPDARLILHGHKLGFALIGRECCARETIGDLARRLAYDAAMFDQQACLSPHWIFVEQGGEVGAEEFAGRLAEALRELEKKLPRGTSAPEEAVGFSRAWDDLELATALGEPVSIHSVRGEDRFLVAIDERRPPRPSCLGRTVRVIPLERLADAPAALAEYAGYFQNAALEAGEERIAELAEMLARLGLCRICRPGRMATPTMMWHHDGKPCLETLVRYCDLEE